MKFSVTWYDQLSSTSDHLKALAKAGRPLASGTLVAAREQTEGRGRRGRKWLSVSNRNLTFSFYVSSTRKPEDASALPMAVALGLQDALAETDIVADLKWPNDLFVRGKKICGILTETGGKGIVVGIGLNVNMTEKDAEWIDQPATSLFMETGKPVAVETVLKRVLKELGPWVDCWLKSGFAGFSDEWTRRYPGIGSSITLRQETGCLSGVLVGFGAQGQLLLADDEGQTRELWAGELR